MQIRKLINSITMVESFNPNLAFSLIPWVPTFKLTCLTVSRQNCDAVKNLETHAIYSVICSSIPHSHQCKSFTETTQAQ